MGQTNGVHALSDLGADLPLPARSAPTAIYGRIFASYPSCTSADAVSPIVWQSMSDALAH